VGRWVQSSASLWIEAARLNRVNISLTYTNVPLAAEQGDAALAIKTPFPWLTELPACSCQGTFRRGVRYSDQHRKLGVIITREILRTKEGEQQCEGQACAREEYHDGGKVLCSWERIAQ
jgi:hypothetical protein